ncbi:MAG: bifunctional diaminohydroxyphosphoribosylaminopyrimidine deaminase/5-amino-6-(5-phosphoribosylamino)uracil reductase RibD [Bacteroides sp.]|nr:bifunctional diaminohydroxyphosphoribosylaminopyrimidine deaminase/5-amino-6-(5-phosphoribosylamino)uracil reductase RibD [Bacteroides sp.]MCM1549532.1 bifunctional diaminohydroxyphosphoribosylaminopyrimidine deaminase/5-amino-6-(5-phosphoribosylamino)uracil reductase RibD [Clostridium sp.]
MTEEAIMRHAIALAGKAEGKTNPNPMVGAVVVKNGRIIGEGYHQYIGGLHAERNALASCTESPEGAAIYVTLEPCCHYGKTPPCTEAILEHKLAKVVIGSRDPNPKVAGKGAAILRQAGVAVVEDFLREECDALNPVFFHYIQNKMPYIALKYAMTADGKIAANSGASQWITGEAARTHVHRLRNYYKGILVGIGTVLQDNPMLTCRIPDGRNPIRIVCDSHLRIPLDCRLCNTTNQAPVIIACVDDPEHKQQALEAKGVQVLFTAEQNGSIDIPDLLRQLGELEIDGILVEGGGTMNAAFVAARQIHHVYAYVGAQIFGGVKPYTPVSGSGIEVPADSLKLCHPRVQTFGDDILMEYDVTGQIKKEEC